MKISFAARFRDRRGSRPGGDGGRWIVRPSFSRQTGPPRTAGRPVPHRSGPDPPPFPGDAAPPRNRPQFHSGRVGQLPHQLRRSARIIFLERFGFGRELHQGLFLLPSSTPPKKSSLSSSLAPPPVIAANTDICRVSGMSLHVGHRGIFRCSPIWKRNCKSCCTRCSKTRKSAWKLALPVFLFFI